MRRETKIPTGFLPLLAFSVVVFLPGCGQEGITGPGMDQDRDPIPRPTYDLVVEPVNPVLELGESIQLKAYWRNSDTGVLHLAGPVRWVSEAPRHVIISEEGLLEAHRKGEVTITATPLEFIGQDPLLAKEATAIVLVR